MNLQPILYAEDEENDAFFLERAFSQAGVTHPLVILPDGEETINYCAGHGPYADRDKHPHPCLLLLDLNLPRKSGLEVLKWIRSDPTMSTLPVIVLTSSLQDTDIHRAYLQGANAYLVKPAKPNELVAMVRTIKDFWLDQNRSHVKPWDLFTSESFSGGPPA